MKTKVINIKVEEIKKELIFNFGILGLHTSDVWGNKKIAELKI